jgi:hypothetical protein
MEIISINITKNIFNEAYKRNEKYKAKYGNCGTHRINKDRQRMTGYLAEACISHRFPQIQYSEIDNVDFTLGTLTMDSKAQGCNSKPLLSYVATLYEEQKNRPVDFYIFSRVKNDFSTAWICGIISKHKFFELSRLIPAGTKNNNFTYDQSRYEIQYKDLENIHTFINQNIHETI